MPERPFPGYGMEERQFELSPEKDDELSNLFEELVEDGGTTAIEEILLTLADSAAFQGEISVDNGKEEGNSELISWGRSLVKASDELIRLAKKIHRL